MPARSISFPRVCRLSDTPARNRLFFARSPPSVSQLSQGKLADPQSASTRIVGWPAGSVPTSLTVVGELGRSLQPGRVVLAGPRPHGSDQTKEQATAGDT